MDLTGRVGVVAVTNGRLWIGRSAEPAIQEGHA